MQKMRRARNKPFHEMRIDFFLEFLALLVHTVFLDMSYLLYSLVYLCQKVKKITIKTEQTRKNDKKHTRNVLFKK